ncbi:unnamed protein product [Coregonus sp. 'balchen']|nr:unnamed protein product [Coregonus sp. 'balchen']
MAANSSSTVSKPSNSTGGKQSGPSAEQVCLYNEAFCNFVQSNVVAVFQRMRSEQRSMASKAAELEMEINEHRKCFRLVGGVLVERTISKIVESLNTQMQSKGRELTEYREKYNIRLVGEGEEGQGKSAASSNGSGSKGGAGVLVS